MTDDPRIHVDSAHLAGLEARAAGFDFLPRQPVGSVLSGRRAARVRGRGLEFEEIRGYLPGDDVRAIDWKVTARTGSPHVRVTREERDRPALIVADQLMSMFFGTVLNMKSVAAAEIAAMAAWRILAAGDRVGGIVLSDDGFDAVVARRRPRRGASLPRSSRTFSTPTARTDEQVGAQASTRSRKAAHSLRGVTAVESLTGSTSQHCWRPARSLSLDIITIV